MMNVNPKVSVVIPVYNAEKYLRQCLDSVINQTLQDIEIICVDDGSTDNSLDILQEYAKKDKRIQIIYQHNQFAGVARNNGMAQAKGEYILFLDVCNCLDLNLLYLMTRASDENAVDIVMAPEDIVGSNSEHKIYIPNKYIPTNTSFSWQDFPKYIFNYASINTATRLYRREFLHQNNLIYPPFQAESEIYHSLYALVLAKKIFVLDNVDAFVHHYITENVNEEKERVLLFQDSYSLLQSRLKQAGIYEELTSSFANKVLIDGIFHIQNIKNDEICKLVKYYFVKEMIYQFDIWDKVKDYFYDYEKYDILQKYILELETDKSNSVSSIAISVVIPVYNAEQYIEKCAESLLAQTLKNIEIIFVDDGSTDDTLKILSDLSLRDARIKVLHQNNLYAGVARNNGLEQARGEYVIFLDADDFFEKKMLEIMHHKAKTYDADIIICAANRFDSNTEKFLPMPWLLKEEYLPTKDVFNFNDLPNTFFQLTISVPWNKLFKKSFLEKIKIKFQNNRRANDLYFTYTAMSLAEKICVVNKIFVHYRVNTGKNLQANNDKNPTNFLRALMGLKYHLIQNNIYEKIKQSFVNAAMTNSMYTLDTVKQSPTATYILSEQLAMFYLNEFEILDKPADYFYNNDYYKMLERYKSKANLSKYLFNVTPKVSVITPVYNAENYLAECVESLLVQTLSECEFIFVDDGSTDNSLNMLIRYAQLDKRIKVYTQANSYAGVARNNGISHANGEYITFLDSDDIMLPNALEIFYEQAEMTKADIVVSSAYRFSNDVNKKSIDGSALRKKYLPSEKIFSLENHAKYIFQISTGAPWGKFYRRSFVEKNEFYFPNTPRSEDFFFVFWSFAVAQSIAVLDKPTVLHREVAGNGSLEAAKEKYPLAQVEVRKLLWQKLNEIGVYEIVEQSFVNGAINSVAYNMSCFRSIDSFSALYEKLKEEIVPLYKIDLTQADYFYDKNDYNFVKKLYDSDSCMDYLFNKYIELRRTVGNYSYELGKVRKSFEKDKQNINSAKLKGTNELDWYKNEIMLIYNSASFRIGRTITWLPRKVRGGMRCYKEHGLLYTLHRLLVKLHLAKDEFDNHALFFSNKQVIAQTNKPKEIVRDYSYYEQLSSDKYADELKIWYKKITGEDLNLENPQTYNEKIQWLKLYDSTPIKTRLADKYLVREWVKERIGEQYLIPLLGVWDSFDDIDFDKLPNQFVLKANHGCGWNIIVKDKKEFDINDAKRKFNVWMKTNFAFQFGLELHYMNISPKIIAEEYLENNNNDLYDYKVFCFDGKAESIMYLSERKKGLKMAFYDLNWNKQNFVYTYPQNTADIPKPKNLQLLVELSEKLAQGFAHVRVDFYILNDGSLKFGELTFSSASGSCKWNPAEQNKVYGDLIKLPSKSPIPKREFGGLKQ